MPGDKDTTYDFVDDPKSLKTQFEKQKSNRDALYYHLVLYQGSKLSQDSVDNSKETIKKIQKIFWIKIIQQEGLKDLLKIDGKKYNKIKSASEWDGLSWIIYQIGYRLTKEQQKNLISKFTTKNIQELLEMIEVKTYISSKPDDICFKTPVQSSNLVSYEEAVKDCKKNIPGYVLEKTSDIEKDFEETDADPLRELLYLHYWYKNLYQTSHTHLGQNIFHKMASRVPISEKEKFLAIKDKFTDIDNKIVTQDDFKDMLGWTRDYLKSRQSDEKKLITTQKSDQNPTKTTNKNTGGYLYRLWERENKQNFETSFHNYIKTLATVGVVDKNDASLVMYGYTLFNYLTTQKDSDDLFLKFLFPQNNLWKEEYRQITSIAQNLE